MKILSVVLTYGGYRICKYMAVNSIKEIPNYKNLIIRSSDRILFNKDKRTHLVSKNANPKAVDYGEIYREMSSKNIYLPPIKDTYVHVEELSFDKAFKVGFKYFSFVSDEKEYLEKFIIFYSRYIFGFILFYTILIYQ